MEDGQRIEDITIMPFDSGLVVTMVTLAGNLICGKKKCSKCPLYCKNPDKSLSGSLCTGRFNPPAPEYDEMLAVFFQLSYAPLNFVTS